MKLNGLKLNEYYNIKSFIVVLYRVFATDIIVIKIIKSVFCFHIYIIYICEEGVGILHRWGCDTSRFYICLLRVAIGAYSNRLWCRKQTTSLCKDFVCEIHILQILKNLYYETSYSNIGTIVGASGCPSCHPAQERRLRNDQSGLSVVF